MINEDEEEEETAEVSGEDSTEGTRLELEGSEELDDVCPQEAISSEDKRRMGPRTWEWGFIIYLHGCANR